MWVMQQKRDCCRNKYLLALQGASQAADGRYRFVCIKREALATHEHIQTLQVFLCTYARPYHMNRLTVIGIVSFPPHWLTLCEACCLEVLSTHNRSHQIIMYLHSHTSLCESGFYLGSLEPLRQIAAGHMEQMCDRTSSVRHPRLSCWYKVQTRGSTFPSIHPPIQDQFINVQNTR